MKRREFMVVVGGAAAWPLAAGAQQKTVPVIGFLSTRTARDSQGLLAGFHRGLNEVGFTEGRNVALAYRWADAQTDRLPVFTAELVALRVAVIVAVGSAGRRAANRFSQRERSC